MRKDNKVTIPTGNYVKLALIILVTVLGVFYFRSVYINDKEYNDNIPIIREVLVSEINSTEVYHYVRENENTILYIGVASDDNCRSLEKELKSVITSKGLENSITYLNLTDENKKSSFIKEFNKVYDTKLLGYPSFVLFEDGEVKDILTVKRGNKLSVSKVIDFLDRSNTNNYD